MYKKTSGFFKFTKNTVNYKKSQITIMVILGMVAIIIFSLLYFATKIGESQSIEDRVVKLADERAQAASVEKHVTACLDKALEDSLILLAGQGGYIHKHQPGSILTWDTSATDPQAVSVARYETEGMVFDVAYRLEADPNDVTPFYPCKTATGPPVYCGFISNFVLFPQLYNYDFGAVKPLFIDYGPFSIQNQLRAYVENATASCVNFTLFRTFDITAGAIEATVNISDKDVTASLTFPLTIQVPNYYPVIKKYRFRSVKNLNLALFHEAVSEIIREDNRYLDFDIKENTLLGRRGDNKTLRIRQFAVLVDKIENWKGFDDLIRIIDTSTKLGGKQFTFQFMRANRPPALDLIRGNVAVPKQYDYIILKGTHVIFEPKANDPDEDILIYSYSGYNYTELMDSYLWKTPGDCQYRCANFTFNDEGDFNITIYATDGQFTDYQLVRIKVESSSTAYVSTEKVFPDISEQYGSIEDPYIIKSESVMQQGVTYKYSWQDDSQSIVSQSPESCLVIPSIEKCAANLTITPNDMTGFFKTIGSHILKLNLLGNNNAVVSTSESAVEVKNCLPYDSAENIPSYPYHNITGDKFPSSGNLGFAPFLGTHTCCAGSLTTPASWAYAGTSTECFNYELKNTCYPTHDWQRTVPGILGIMPVTELTTGSPVKLTPISNPAITVPICPQGEDCSNDIFNLTLTQKCSSNRGNACSGEYNFEYTHVKSCADKQEGFDETCTGPPLNSTLCPFSPLGVGRGDITCFAYGPTKTTEPSQTFEKSFLGTGTGACKHEEKCSVIGPGGYGAGGDYLCNATCNPGTGNCDYASLDICYNCNDNEQTDYWIECRSNELRRINYDWSCSRQTTNCEHSSNSVDIGLESNCNVTFYEGCELDLNKPIKGNYRTNITEAEYLSFLDKLQGNPSYPISKISWIHPTNKQIRYAGCTTTTSPDQCIPQENLNYPDTFSTDADHDGFETGCYDIDDNNPCLVFKRDDEGKPDNCENKIIGEEIKDRGCPVTGSTDISSPYQRYCAG